MCPARPVHEPRPRSRSVLVALLVTVTVLAGACGGGNKEAAKPKPKPTTTTRARQTTIDVEIGRAMLETASLSSPPFPDEVRDPVKSGRVRSVGAARMRPR